MLPLRVRANPNPNPSPMFPGMYCDWGTWDPGNIGPFLGETGNMGPGEHRDDPVLPGAGIALSEPWLEVSPLPLAW